MPRVLFMAAHRPGRSPSQRFRFEQYLSFLEHNGYDYNFSYLISESDDRKFYSKGNYLTKFSVLLSGAIRRYVEIQTANEYDIVFVQREAFMTGTTFFEKNISRSRAMLIFDFDDSIWLSNVSDGNKNLEWLKDYNKTSRIIELADLVIAGNRYLEGYALQYNSRIAIIPTTIDTREYIRNGATPSNTICIGWSGSITTIQHFLYAIPFLRRIKEKYKYRVSFKVIGDKNYSNPELGIKGISWKKEREIVDLSSIDIGIMPLPDDEWAKGKCGLKGLQYMALEIPTVMSPVGVNTEIIEDGRNGFLAATENEWVEKLSLLIESEELRNKFGRAARKTVEERYSVESQKQNYLNCFNEVLQLSK